MNSTAQHSLSPLVQYNQVISIYGKKSAFVRGLNKSCIMYYLKLNIPPSSHNRCNRM